VSGLRSGTTLVSTLNFATPAEELEYERRRHHSYHMLVSMVMQERQEASEALGSLVGHNLKESEELRERAEKQAAAGEHEEAIRTMEEATSRLIRILQAGGVGVAQ